MNNPKFPSITLIFILRLLQKSLFVIPEVFIGNPVFFKTKDFWIPAFAGMTAKAISSIQLREAPLGNDLII
jgi:hypothetical protein